MAVVRQNLREQIRDELLARLKDGTIQAGEGINEAQLAAELGVSRTPLREALLTMESEGRIESNPGRGFRFAVATPEELREITPIIGALECLALDLTPVEHLKAISGELLRLNDELAQVATHSEVVIRDEQWHLLLTKECGNERLLALLASLKSALHRFEYQMVPIDQAVERSSEEHRAVANALAEGDIEKAKTHLKINWIEGISRIIGQKPN